MFDRSNHLCGLHPRIPSCRECANSSVNSEDRGYTYDPAWNLNYRTNNGSLQTFTVDGKNQLSSV